MRLQKAQVITIQRCDKGGGIIILNIPDYIRAGENHLKLSMKKDNSSKVNFYRKVNEKLLDTAKGEILAVLDDAHKDGIISNEEYRHMDPNEKAAARLDMLFKVHKAHQEGTAPPERPVISGSGSITENPSRF